MPEYEFEDATGARRTEFYEMAYAPRLGTWVEIDGHQWQRVPSRIGGRADAPVYFESMSAPLNDPEVAKAGGTYNSFGEAVFTTRRSCEEYASRKGITYGD